MGDAIGTYADDDVVGREGRATWSARRWIAAALALGLVAAVAWWVDRDRSRAEEAALAACRADGARALSVLEDEVGAAASFARPSLAFQTSEQSRAGLLEPIAEAAARTRPGVERAARSCGRVEVWGMHDELRRARVAYTDHLTAEADRLGVVAADPVAWYGYPAELRDERERLFR